MAASIHRITSIAAAAFGLLCTFYGAWPVWRACFPLEIDLKEPWNAYHADAALGSGVLYPELSDLIANNYPPLWYYLTGALSRFTIDAIYVGRALSLLATLAISATVVLCIRQFKADWSAALVGGLFFFGTMLRYADWYVAMNDPNLLALAIMMIALQWLLARIPGHSAEPTILLMVLAGFFKHALVAVPTTALFWLARSSPRLALRAALVAVAAAALGVLLFVTIYGMAFIEQLFLYPRELSLERAWNSLGRLGGLLPALAMWAIWAWFDCKSEPARFSATFIAFAFAAYVLQKLGAGVDVNAQFELTAALAIGIGLAYDRIAVLPIGDPASAERRRLAVIGILALTLIAAPGLEPYYLLASPNYRAQFSKNAEVLRSEIGRVREIHGTTVCSILSVCRAAGKPFIYDVFFIGQRGATGRLTAAEIDARGIGYEFIDRRASLQPLQRQLFYGRSK